MSWLWVNLPLAIAFFSVWAIVPLYLVLTRWHRETEARHAEVAAWHAQLISQPPALALVPEQALAAEMTQLPETPRLPEVAAVD